MVRPRDGFGLPSRPHEYGGSEVPLLTTAEYYGVLNTLLTMDSCSQSDIINKRHKINARHSIGRQAGRRLMYYCHPFNIDINLLYIGTYNCDISSKYYYSL